MKEDILINGVSVAELKRQKELIQKDASKIVSNSIDAAVSILEKLLDEDEDGDDILATPRNEAEALAAEALDHLETAEIVAAVSGVSFYLPWDYEYGDEQVWSSRVENVVYDGDYSAYSKTKLYALMNQLSSMESDSRNWHESRC